MYTRIAAMLDMEDFLFIQELYNQGVTISQIARETGFDRKTIRKYVLSGEPPTARPRVRGPGHRRQVKARHLIFHTPL